MRLWRLVAIIATFLVVIINLYWASMLMHHAPLKLLMFLLSCTDKVDDFVCSIFTCCETSAFPKNSVLENINRTLPGQLHGQPMALIAIQDIISKNFDDFENGFPISMHLSGPRGTGKSHACKLIAECLYPRGIESNLVHKFEGDDLFKNEIKTEYYLKNLKYWIHGNLTLCSRSMFIFENTEKMPQELLEIIHPFLNAKLGGIFLFTTTKVNPKIMEKYRMLKYQGAKKPVYPKEEFQEFYETLSYTIDREYRLNILSESIFLPLDLNDLQYCMLNEFVRLGRPVPSECTIQKVYSILELYDDQDDFLSCKDIIDITRWVVMHEEC